MIRNFILVPFYYLMVQVPFDLQWIMQPEHLRSRESGARMIWADQQSSWVGMLALVGHADQPCENCGKDWRRGGTAWWARDHGRCISERCNGNGWWRTWTLRMRHPQPAKDVVDTLKGSCTARGVHQFLACEYSSQRKGCLCKIITDWLWGLWTKARVGGRFIDKKCVVGLQPSQPNQLSGLPFWTGTGTPTGTWTWTWTRDHILDHILGASWFKHETLFRL